MERQKGRRMDRQNDGWTQACEEKELHLARQSCVLMTFKPPYSDVKYRYG